MRAVLSSSSNFEWIPYHYSKFQNDAEKHVWILIKFCKSIPKKNNETRVDEAHQCEFADSSSRQLHNNNVLWWQQIP